MQVQPCVRDESRHSCTFDCLYAIVPAMVGMFMTACCVVYCSHDFSKITNLDVTSLRAAYMCRCVRGFITSIHAYSMACMRSFQLCCPCL
jgi:hypothetical protein